METVKFYRRGLIDRPSKSVDADLCLSYAFSQCQLPETTTTKNKYEPAT